MGDRPQVGVPTFGALFFIYGVLEFFHSTPLALRRGVGGEASSFFDDTDALFCFCCLFPLLKLNFSFDFTETPSPQRLHGERSPSQRRALVIKTPSLRQLVESEGAVQSIHTCDAENPLKSVSKFPEALLSVPLFDIAYYLRTRKFGG